MGVRDRVWRGVNGLRYIACLLEFMGHVCMALGGDHGFTRGETGS